MAQVVPPEPMAEKAEPVALPEQKVQTLPKTPLWILRVLETAVVQAPPVATLLVAEAVVAATAVQAAAVVAHSHQCPEALAVAAVDTEQAVARQQRPRPPTTAHIRSLPVVVAADTEALVAEAVKALVQKNRRPTPVAAVVAVATAPMERAAQAGTLQAQVVMEDWPLAEVVAPDPESQAQPMVQAAMAVPAFAFFATTHLA
jgi:hypothetical protein